MDISKNQNIFNSYFPFFSQKKRVCIEFLEMSLSGLKSITMRIILPTTLLILTLSFPIFAQDTLVGWTIPVGTNHQRADVGNILNKGGMYLEAVDNDALAFCTIHYTYTGNTSMAASSNNWQNGKGNKSWKVSCDATGYEKMKLYCKISSDSNYPGPRNFKLQYRLGCCSPEWHDIIGITLQAGEDWTTGMLDGIDIPNDSKDMPGLQVRWLLDSDTATDGNFLKSDGISLIDDVYITAEKISGINDNFEDQIISLYPNPVDDNLIINGIDRDFTVTIFNATGQEVINSNLIKAKNEINMSGLNSGIYLINIQTDKGIIHRKVTKN